MNNTLTTTEQRGIFSVKGNNFVGHFALIQEYGTTWVTRRKIGSPKTASFLPFNAETMTFTQDNTVTYER